MTQHRTRRTDQEWFDLIRNCQTSSLKVADWCSRQDITLKALYYHNPAAPLERIYDTSKKYEGCSGAKAGSYPS